jgi:hypothetical protein
VPERLALNAVDRLGEPSLEWARAALIGRSDAGAALIADDLRRQTAAVARIDGAVAGTPFLVALVPGYLGYLWQEAQMMLRTAALYGRDPRSMQAAAELLTLRGVHPTVQDAQAALEVVRAAPLPEKPESRRSLRTWVRSVRMVLVLGGFLDSPDRGARSRPLAVAAFVTGIGLWVVTWVFPLTFMVAMSWTCERDARALGRRAQLYYSGDAASTEAAIRAARSRQDRGHGLRQLIRSVGLLASVAVPIAFVAYADHVRNTTGVNWVGALGAIVALSLVIATTVVARRR